MSIDARCLERIKILLKELLELLLQNGGKTLTSGVRAMIRILDDNESFLEENMDDIKSIFKTMMGGMGTLGEFIISHPNPEVEDKLNAQLNQILDELWNLLGLDLSNLPDVDEGYPPGHS